MRAILSVKTLYYDYFVRDLEQRYCSLPENGSHVGSGPLSVNTLTAVNILSVNTI